MQDITKRFLLALFYISVTYVFFGNIAYGYDSSTFVSPQTSSGLGSNSSQIQVFSGALQYVNNKNNSSIIGNYFTGTYYDSLYGNFNVRPFVNSIQNVRIVSSVSICGPNDYGYKLGGYAYSETAGYVDFDYNDSIFVYICMSDQTLRGYTYSSHLGFQNFTGISIDINYKNTPPAELPTNNTNFTNDTPSLSLPNIQDQGDYEISGKLPSAPTYPVPNTNAVNSQPFRFNGSVLEFTPENESLFYIIK